MPPPLVRRACVVAVVSFQSLQNCRSSTCSLRTQPTSSGRLILPQNAARRLSSSRPAAPPSSERRRGQRSMVSLCPCEVLFQFHLDAVVLYALLLGHFFHRIHWNTAGDVCFAAVTAVLVKPLPR